MSPITLFDEADAISALCRGRRDALALLYQQYHHRLLLLLQQRDGDLSITDREDVVHNVFIRLERVIHTYDPGKGPFYPWLASITLNESRDFSACNQRYQPLPSVLFGADFPEQSACFRVCIESALARCGQAKNPYKLEQCLEALWIFAHSNCVAETAAAIGRSPAATREFLSQSRKKLKPYLFPCLTECGALILPDAETGEWEE